MAIYEGVETGSKNTHKSWLNDVRFVYDFVTLQIINLDIKLSLISMISTVMLIFKNKDQILVRCIHIEINIVIFCGILGLDNVKFIARVIDLYLADL